MPVGGNNLWSPFHLGDCDWFTGKSEVMPGTDSQRRWPEVGFWEVGKFQPGFANFRRMTD
jgi:hypothetical protein